MLYEVSNEFGGASLVAQMVKESAHNVGDPGLILGPGRSFGEGNGNPLQYSCGLQSRGSQRVGHDSASNTCPPREVPSARLSRPQGQVGSQDSSWRPA